MDKKGIKLGLLFVVVVVLFAGISIFTIPKVNPNSKDIVVEVISKRDEYNKKFEYQTEFEYLGELLKEEELVTYQDSDYGMYITGVKGMNDDMTNEYWWAISIDGQSAQTGAEGIALEKDTTYTLELKQGY